MILSKVILFRVSLPPSYRSLREFKATHHDDGGLTLHVFLPEEFVLFLLEYVLLQLLELLLVTAETEEEVDLAVLLDDFFLELEREIVNPEQEEVHVRQQYYHEEKNLRVVRELSH